VTSKQLLITISYSIASILAIAALVAVFMSTSRRRREAVPEESKLARLEDYWGYFVTALLVVLLALTIVDLPYGKSDAHVRTHVSVIAQQFAWNIQPSTVPAGVPVEITLRSRDVQHGFGIYSSNGRKLLFQVQVPASGEHSQKVVFTFPHSGVYTIDCLEFCGFHHHLMVATMRAS
jgi:cytochrome c oxidase subunit 2